MTEQSIEEEATAMVATSDELVKEIGALCHGHESPIVVVACMEVVGLVCEQMPQFFLKETADLMRALADRIEENIRGDTPMQ